MPKLTSARWMHLDRLRTVATTLTDDGRIVSEILEKFEIRMSKDSKNKTACAAVELSFALDSASPVSLTIDSRFGGILPDDATILISIITQESFAQKLLRSEDINSSTGEWTEVIRFDSAQTLQLILLIQAIRESTETDLLFSWDSVDISVSA